jgi:hypothetical protein
MVTNLQLKSHSFFHVHGHIIQQWHRYQWQSECDRLKKGCPRFEHEILLTSARKFGGRLTIQ